MRTGTQPTWTTDLNAPRGLWLLLVALPLVLMAAFLIYTSLQTLPRLSLAPAFSLIDQDGIPLTNETLRGKLVLYNFVDARCADNCEAGTQLLAQLQAARHELDTSGLPLHFVTVAPALDHPIAAHAVSATDVDTAQWHFVSGDAELFHNFLQSTRKADASHTAYLVLVDGWGIVRAIYMEASPNLADIQRDIRLVAQEAQQRGGVNRVGYEAVHLFMCHNGL